MSIKKKEPSPRIRRTPEESRANILAAAETLLVEQGPQTLRLADVAKAAGVANATVLHHFGSIDAVQQALMERMIADLVDAIMAIEIPADAPAEARAIGLKTLFDALESRLAAWLELTDETSRLTVVREAVQEVAQKKISQGGIPSELAEDMILMSVTLALGTGLFGPSLGTLIDKPPERARELTLQMLMSYFEKLAG